VSKIDQICLVNKHDVI